MLSRSEYHIVIGQSLDPEPYITTHIEDRALRSTLGPNPAVRSDPNPRRQNSLASLDSLNLTTPSSPSLQDQLEVTLHITDEEHPSSPSSPESIESCIEVVASNSVGYLRTPGKMEDTEEAGKKRKGDGTGSAQKRKLRKLLERQEEMTPVLDEQGFGKPRGDLFFSATMEPITYRWSRRCDDPFDLLHDQVDGYAFDEDDLARPRIPFTETILSQNNWQHVFPSVEAWGTAPSPLTAKKWFTRGYS